MKITISVPALLTITIFHKLVIINKLKSIVFYPNLSVENVAGTLYAVPATFFSEIFA